MRASRGENKTYAYRLQLQNVGGWMDIFLGCDRWIDRELPEAKINLSARGFLDSNRGVGASDIVVVAVTII